MTGKCASGFAAVRYGVSAKINLDGAYDADGKTALFNIRIRDRDPVTRREWPGPSYSLTAHEQDWMNMLTHEERCFLEGTYDKRDLDWIQERYAAWRNG